MKRSTAVRHLLEMADVCADLDERLATLDSTVRVVSLWAYGAVLLGPDAWPGDLQENVRAAVAISLPEPEVPWYARPAGTGWIASMVRWDKRPVHIMWRSADAPVWNHVIERPLLLWDDVDGVRTEALDALTVGTDIERHREPAPTPDDVRQRLEREARASLDAMTRTAADYDEHRWGRGKLSTYAEPLWEATAGYLDVRSALEA